MKRASIPEPMGRLGRIPERTIWCKICGRPLRPGEDFGQWRIRALQRSSRYLFDVCAICPAHYGDDPDGHGPPLAGGRRQRNRPVDARKERQATPGAS